MKRNIPGGLYHPLLALLLLIVAALAISVQAQSTDRYAGLPQQTTVQGFPQIGYPSALVDVKIYAAFDDPPSGQFWTQSFDTVLQHVRNGEIRVTFIPLFGQGTLTGGRSAARAAICANDQSVFWPYVDQLFALQTQYANDAYSGNRLTDAIGALGVDAGQWNTCLGGDGPDVILDAAAKAANAEPTFTQTPYVVIGDGPSLTDPDSLNFTINLQVRKANDLLQSQLQATAEATSQVDRYTYNPLAHDPIPPPLEITLPDKWTYAYDAIVLQDIDGIRPIPFALYRGPLASGGMGDIVLLWGFPNLVVGAPAGGVVQPDLWTDGTRLLRLAIVEGGCNVGTDLRRDYSVGGLQAVGTQWAAVSCPQLADTRGWFAGLRQFNVNFVFYVYTEPIGAMDAAQAQLQSILDTVKFVLPKLATPEPTAEVTPGS